MRNPIRRLFARRPPGGLTCAELGELLQRYLDEDVETDVADRIDAHLEACRRCGLEAETYRRIKASLASRRIEVPAESLDRLRRFGEQLAHDGDAGGR